MRYVFRSSQPNIKLVGLKQLCKEKGYQLSPVISLVIMQTLVGVDIKIATVNKEEIECTGELINIYLGNDVEKALSEFSKTVSLKKREVILYILDKTIDFGDSTWIEDLSIQRARLIEAQLDKIRRGTGISTDAGDSDRIGPENVEEIKTISDEKVSEDKLAEPTEPDGASDRAEGDSILDSILGW